MGHDRFHGTSEVGRHKWPLASRAFPPFVANFRGELYDFPFADIHPQFVVLDVTTGPGHFSGKTLTGKRAARDRKITGRLSVAVYPGQRVGIMIERVCSAAPRIEQDP